MRNAGIAAVLISAFGVAACDRSPETAVAPSAIAAAGATQQHGAPDAPGQKRYRVTIENLTIGQPFSPGVAVTHTQKASLFQVGSTASAGIRAIAEDGDPSVAVAALAGQPGIDEVVELTSPVHRVGGPGPTTLTFEIGASANANRLSLAVMLICTNDGFTGLDGIKLPGGFSPDVYSTAGYDGGTEANNEQFTQIVDPCQAIGPVAAPPDGNGRVATSGVIAHHPGVLGVADLKIAQHGWRGPVARILVERLK
ncbi:MAG: spondin domain-containing protein [Acidobacteria bacterium]|nr:spondin domain-containing protein [Acidobacteriota bacterium]